MWHIRVIWAHTPQTDTLPSSWHIPVSSTMIAKPKPQEISITPTADCTDFLSVKLSWTSTSYLLGKLVPGPRDQKFNSDDSGLKPHDSKKSSAVITISPFKRRKRGLQKENWTLIGPQDCFFICWYPFCCQVSLTYISPGNSHKNSEVFKGFGESLLFMLGSPPPGGQLEPQ